MRDLSRWWTIAPLQAVTDRELEVIFAGSAGPLARVVGTGINHAFDSPTGRFVMVSSTPGDLYPVADGTLMPEMPEQMRAHPELWEWAHLAGPPDNFPLSELPVGEQLDTRAEHARGDDWVASEVALRDRARDAGLIPRLRDILVVEDLNAILPTVRSVAHKHAAMPRYLLKPSIEKARAFHAALPSRSVMVDLRYWQLKETQFTPRQHDRLDILSNAVALTYCDLVITEARMADLARKARIEARFGTRTLANVRDVPGLLRELARSEDI